MKRLVINSQKGLKIIAQEKEYVLTQAKFGPSKITKIPLKITEDLAFFVATIIGDGHLKKSKKQIVIELTDKKLLESIKEKCLNLFERKFNIKAVKQREGRKKSYSMCMDSKALHNLLNQAFGIQIGRKSHIVKIPKQIKKANKKIKCSFLKGIMETEGGKRRRGLGLSTASKQLWKDLTVMFNEVGIRTSEDKWIYKKYEKEYYGITFKPKYIDILMQGCRSGQTE